MRTTKPFALIGLCLFIGSAPVVAQQNTRPACHPQNAGLTLPAGFCAAIFADSVGRARQLVVAPNGDVFVALSNAGRSGGRGGVLALRDSNGDGVADQRERFGENGGNGIALRGGHLYFAPDDAVLRYPLTAGQLTPSDAPDTIVRGLPGSPGHAAKTIVLGRGSDLFVNIGSRSNSCQVQDRDNASPGQDPCTELDQRAGIWLFDANRTGQSQGDGSRFATGLRNMVGLTIGPDGQLYGVQHGRDGLAQQWGQQFDQSYGAENPAEILVRIERGDDYGWPYCFFATQYSLEIKQQVLAPEYGGDGKQVGRCAEKKMPLVTYPGHWAPNALLFYVGRQFPAKYRGGILIAFHGSWNRAPLPQEGFNVVFQPITNGGAAGAFEVFADGFAGPGKAEGRATHRPVGLAMAPDGSLYVTTDVGGRIYRIFYTGR